MTREELHNTVNELDTEQLLDLLIVLLDLQDKPTEE